MAAKQPQKTTPKTPRGVPTGIIFHDATYTLEGLAVATGATPRAIREKYINTGELDAAPFFKGFLIPGCMVGTLAVKLLETNEDETGTED